MKEKKEGPEVIDYIAGLRKVGPSEYRVVSGKIVNGVPELQVDHISQTLQFSADTLKIALRTLIGQMP